MKFPVLIPNIFDHPFTYSSDVNLNIGDYVEVPFGKKKTRDGERRETRVGQERPEENREVLFERKKSARVCVRAVVWCCGKVDS